VAEHFPFKCPTHGETTGSRVKRQGRNSYNQCDECRRERSRAYRRKNKERLSEADKRWRNNNRERLKQRVDAYNKQYAASHREEIRQASLEYARALKHEVITAYGGKCACPNCPEALIDFLCIDHINGNGASHRKQLGGKRLYRWLKQNGFPQDNFQLLCWNCNKMKGTGSLDNCPHNNLKGI
jgi:hypothetical protein